MISKELLKNVLYGESIDNISIISKDITFEYSHYVNGVFQYRRKTDINIYELAFECKKWAYSQGYILFSKIRLSSSLASCYFDVMGKHDYEDSYHNDFRAETESEAIFKACQWILTKDSK